jgi:RNA polymerase sigma factor (sigma-70 family)
MEAAVAPREGVFVAPRLLKLAGDDRLVALVRAGDERAFEAVYDRYHRGILSFCRHMLGSREEAEDAVQHAFLSAYRALVDSDQSVALRPWLYAIARNRCLSVLRARRDEDPLADAAEPSVAGLAAEVERREDLRALLRDLQRLPDDQRAALVLAEVGDLDHEEIAQVIGVPHKKVKALVFQARESLIASRKARETPCAEIREELSTLKGGSLRRTHLRRHLRDCPGCRGYREEVRKQRAGLAVLLPVVPGVGLREATLGGIVASGGATAGMAGGGAALLKGVGAKVVVGALLAAGAVTGGVVGVKELTHSAPGPATKQPASSPAPRGARAAPAVAAAAAAHPQAATRSSAGAPASTSHRSHRKHHHKHKATPVAAAAPTQAATAPVHAPAAGNKGKAKQKQHTGKANGHVKHGATKAPKQTKAIHPTQPKPVKPTKPETPSVGANGGTTAPSAQPDTSGGGNGKGTANSHANKSDTETDG